MYHAEKQVAHAFVLAAFYAYDAFLNQLYSCRFEVCRLLKPPFPFLCNILFGKVVQRCGVVDQRGRAVFRINEFSVRFKQQLVQQRGEPLCIRQTVCAAVVGQLNGLAAREDRRQTFGRCGGCEDADAVLGRY